MLIHEKLPILTTFENADQTGDAAARTSSMTTRQAQRGGPVGMVVGVEGEAALLTEIPLIVTEHDEEFWSRVL